MFPKKNSSQFLAAPRLAGQSLRDEKERLTDNRLIPFYFSTAFLWLLWVVTELELRSHQPLRPKAFLFLAIVATGVTTIVFGRLWGKFRNLNRGERGELLVAEQLEELRAIGFRCYHDIVLDGFNIDHVVVGPPGVFAIETKFRSGSGLIEFRNGQGIFMAGRPEEGNCLKQARSNAATLNKLVRQDAGIEVFVKPLVVFVGDWKIKNAWRDTDVRVITADDVAIIFSARISPY